MVWEARLAFILFFFFCWTVCALLPWSVAAVLRRGRGAFLALPLAIGGAWAAGIAVPLAGLRDMNGFTLSLLAALAGSAAGSLGGLYFWRKLQEARPQRERPQLDHPIGARRPAVEPAETAPSTTDK